MVGLTVGCEVVLVGPAVCIVEVGAAVELPVVGVGGWVVGLDVPEVGRLVGVAEVG